MIEAQQAWDEYDQAASDVMVTRWSLRMQEEFVRRAQERLAEYLEMFPGSNRKVVREARAHLESNERIAEGTRRDLAGCEEKRREARARLARCDCSDSSQPAPGLQAKAAKYDELVALGLLEQLGITE